MALFAHVKNNVVKNVIVAEQSWVDALANSHEYIETFDDGKRGMRACPGMLWNPNRNEFYDDSTVPQLNET
jgi:hypothetical protein